MEELLELYNEMGISPAVYALGEKTLDALRDRFAEIDRIAEYNQAKVISAMQKNRVSAACFAATTGYGYDDMGRDNLEKVYADVFHTEAALVRPQITCGTHALTVALSANLLPGDELLSPVGLPYDTLQEVIGIRPSPCSLAEYGVSYRQVDLLDDGGFDYENIRCAINEKTKLIMYASVAGALLNVGLNYIFIGKLGYIAAGYTTLICYITYCVGHYLFMNKVCDEYCDGVRPYEHKKILGITLLFLIAGFVLLMTYHYILLRYGIIVIAGVFALVKRKRIIEIIQSLLNCRK